MASGDSVEGLTNTRTCRVFIRAVKTFLVASSLATGSLFSSVIVPSVLRVARTAASTSAVGLSKRASIVLVLPGIKVNLDLSSRVLKLQPKPKYKAVVRSKSDFKDLIEGQ